MKIESAKKTITIALSQINNSFSNHNYLPYSVAILQCYVEKYSADPNRYQFLIPLYKRIRVKEAVSKLISADIVAFSTYVWNVKLSLEIARQLKAQKPEILIVCGGPQIPDQPEEFLREHPFVDLVVHNEGEITFLNLLEQYPNREWSGLAGVSYLTETGKFVKNANAPRIQNIATVPSPFLEGTFDPLIAANPQETWIVLWETNRGCPFQCTFCDWGSATAAKVTQFDLERLKQEVDWFIQQKVEFVFCCDANFGILPRDVEIANYIAQNKKQFGYPKSLSVQNTKNATERAYQTQKILSDAGLNKGVALSLQSLDHTTLVNIKRQNISIDTYMELQKRFTKDRVETYTDLILGLPGETFDSFVNGISELMEKGQHNRIQFNNLSILPNAEMGNAQYQAKFGMKTIESRIINVHGALEDSQDGIYETQQLVVATDSMPPEEWKKTRAFSWMAALLHFDKLLQIPIIMTHELTGISYRKIIEAFIYVLPARYPLMAEIVKFFNDFAGSIQKGHPEYVYSQEWLGIYWPADEYIFIHLTSENKLAAFYDEAEKILVKLIKKSAGAEVESIIREAVTLNRELIKQPNQKSDIIVNAQRDILRTYSNILVGVREPDLSKPVQYNIDRTSEVWNDFQQWCREVVWYGNKKGAYLYGNKTIETALAGHY